jgi:hypothetical protein
MFTSAPPPSILPMLEHGVPSQLRHGGGGGWAPAKGAAAIAAAAAPANNMGVIFVSFTIMYVDYHDHRMPKP